MKIYISQGSVANYNVTNFPQNVPDKKNENRSVLGEDMDKSLRLILGATVYRGQAYMEIMDMDMDGKFHIHGSPANSFALRYE